jgi:hypothetical protein
VVFVRLEKEPRFSTERADKLIDLDVRRYGALFDLGIKGELKESKPDIPDWMESADKPKRRRGRVHDDAADDANVSAGRSDEVEF